jgi:hypothetical protein
MVKKLLFILGLTTSGLAVAQVGIGNTLPTATLDVTALNPTGTATNVDGLLIPRVDRSRARVMAGVPTSTIVYVNTINSTQTGQAANIDAVGFYYFDGSVWQKLNAAVALNNDWSLTGNGGTTPGTNYLGTSDAQDLRFRTNNTNRINISNASGQFQTYANGTAALPAFSWNADTNTGIFKPANDNLAFSTNGVQRAIIDNNGRIGVNFAPQTFAQFLSYSNDVAVDAVVGFSDIVGGIGINGRSTGLNGFGVFGSNDNAGGIGVVGFNTLSGIGVLGTVNGVNGNGVLGLANGGNGVGINGQSANATGTGAVGLVTAAGNAANTPIGVLGQANGVSSIGVLGTANGANAVSSAFAMFGIIDNATTNGNTDAAAVGGINANATQGLGYSGPNVLATPSAIVGISGVVSSKRTIFQNSQSYNFGVMGELLVDTGVFASTIQRRSGGVIGISAVGVFGSAGYRNSAGNDFGIYSTSNLNGGAVGTGKMSSQPNSGIGFGAHGGMIGGYAKSENYGFVAQGKQFGAYILGNTFTNKPIAQIETIDNKKTVSYASSSTTVDVSTRGKGELVNGSGFVAFDTNFKNMAILSDEHLNITLTARGNTKGVYIEKITQNGFYVKENMDGVSSVAFNWTAISIKKGYENGIEISKEILNNNWEQNMDKVMHDENDQVNSGTPIYFDGNQVRFETIPEEYTPESRKASPLKNVERKIEPQTFTPKEQAELIDNEETEKK